MSWTNRFTVPIFSALLALAAAIPAWADGPLNATYQHQTIRFANVSTAAGAPAVGIHDPGLRALLRAVGASLTWQPGDREVLITTSVPSVVSFAVGDRLYNAGPLALQAGIAPYRQGSEVYLPLNELLRSLDLALRQDGGAAILQPQLASLDVRIAGGRADVVAHGGAPLHPRVVTQNAETIVYEFDGVGTPLTGTRDVDAGGIRTLQIVQTGTVRDPKTTVTVALAPGAVHDVPRSSDDRDVVISFASSPAAANAPVAPAPAVASPVPAGAPAAGAPAAASVTGVTVAPSDDGYVVTIAIAGSAAFEWHRLREPDNRFWIDVKGAVLQGPPIDQNEPDPVGALRVRQIDPSTVRVAISPAGPKALMVAPTQNGLSVDVGRSDVADVPRAGSGVVGAAPGGDQTALVTPAPLGTAGSSSDTAAAWKFGPHGGAYVARNPRLIVIDPGHGGSDRGTSRHGTDEATLTLDMSRRLRDILVARGWQVRLTHDADVDVFAPNDSAHDELQARVDVANNAGARLFVSIHVNAYVNSGPYGTTEYVSKPDDVALAREVESQLSSDGTKDDGIVKSHLYVTLHTQMPAVLVETAFISNPSDYALLTSPAWRQKVAQSIADGIDRYDRDYPASNAPSQ